MSAQSWADETELYRVKGALPLQSTRLSAEARRQEADGCFRQAIEIAQKQSAKSGELRAATSLARLWPRQGRRPETRDLLAPVYHWFTEGFDTADLKDAKALLEELAKEKRKIYKDGRRRIAEDAHR